MLLRKKQEALSLGLGDAVEVAKDIASNKRELSREFKLSPLKGVRSQSSIQKRIQKRVEQERREQQRAFNPRIKGLDGIPGIEVAEDGTVGLAELREQRPDIFRMKPIPVEGAGPSRMDRINELRKAEGRSDPRYDRLK